MRAASGAGDDDADEDAEGRGLYYELSREGARQRRYTRCVARFRSAAGVLTLLSVLTSLPFLATVCAMLCHPAHHLVRTADADAAVHHHTRSACHDIAAQKSIVVPVSTHDCRSHDARQEPPAVLALARPEIGRAHV